MWQFINNLWLIGTNLLFLGLMSPTYLLSWSLGVVVASARSGYYHGSKFNQ
jgi:hypothetical protein